MKSGGMGFRGVLMGCLLATGCSTGDVSGVDTDAPAAPEAADVAATPAEDGASDMRVRLEKARRSLDRGDAKTAETELEALLETVEDADDKNDVLLELSRAYELGGDQEAAIDAVESILVTSAARDSHEVREPAERRLRYLLTGHEEETSPRLPANGELPPVTAALAEAFQPDADERVLIDVFVFGRPRNGHDGIFEISEAKRFSMEQDLTSNIKVSQSISSSGSWVSLPHAMGEKDPSMPQADRSMLVFYYDLGDNRVPSRYDDYLPMPSEEIAAVLEQGDGLVAARQRPNGKPVIVIAAPRKAQLDQVEAAFADMQTLPYAPAVVPVTRGLSGPEIQAGIRSVRKTMHGCYEKALERDKSLSGKLNLDFAISGEGAIEGLKLGEGSTLKEAGLVECVFGEVRKLTFAATGERRTVSYPILMTPE
ncbi:MAG: AgmX/PglI C-terminal domain-containing protein [Polyangiaceae bacterium]|nr:AgmX/PglI C-terminal domain-containing protein [Polyangiaceae bacterium]